MGVNELGESPCVYYVGNTVRRRINRKEIQYDNNITRRRPDGVHSGAHSRPDRHTPHNGMGRYIIHLYIIYTAVIQCSVIRIYRNHTHSVGAL